jgi:chromosome segregation ATPase
VADIGKQLEQIMKARYGRDVRQSIHDVIDALNGSAEAERQAAERAQRASEAAREKSEEAQRASETAREKSEVAQRASEAAREKSEEAQRETETLKAQTETAKEIAEEKAGTAQEAAGQALDYSEEAESWARGGTGTRENEDTDNSKYYSERAKTSSQTASEYLNKVEQAGENAVQAVRDALDMDVPSFTVDLETGHLVYSGGRFLFNVNKDGHLEWGLAV